MTLVAKYKTKEECENAGYYWKTNFCFRDKEGTMPISIGAFTEITGIDVGQALMDHGGGLTDTWMKLAYQKPPEDFWGRLLWTAGTLGQLVLSLFTFPAALGVFMLEESIQAYSMGGYMLSTANQWGLLLDYLDGFDSFLDGTDYGIKTLATISPITGGAVMMYQSAARAQAAAFRQTAQYKYLKQLETDEKQRIAALATQKYGSIRIISSPSQAEVWLDNVNMETLTPQTYEGLEAGEHSIQLRYYSKKREVWDIWAGTVNITAGKHKEIYLHIPESVSGEEEVPGAEEETDTDKLPKFLTAEITGDIVKDGDTFVTISGEIVRLIGIDTPELGRPYASEAAEYLQDNIEDKKLTIKIQTDKPFDVYGRTLGEVRNYKGNINVAILAAGLARQDWFEEDLFDRTRYQAAEELAKTRRIGIWSKIP